MTTSSLKLAALMPQTADESFDNLVRFHPQFFLQEVKLVYCGFHHLLTHSMIKGMHAILPHNVSNIHTMVESPEGIFHYVHAFQVLFEALINGRRAVLRGDPL